MMMIGGLAVFGETRCIICSGHAIVMMYLRSHSHSV